MRQVRVVLNCDEGFVADALRDFATAYEEKDGDWHEVRHGSGFLEFIEVPDPEPSLEQVFDKKKKEVDDAKKREWDKLRKMDLDERSWVADMVGKLEFLEARGFRVRPYYGGIVDKWPHNYIQIDGKGRWVAIEGSSVRRADGTIDQTSPYIANYLNPTMEELIKIIAKW